MPAKERNHLIALWHILRAAPPQGIATEREFIAQNYSLIPDYLALFRGPESLRTLAERYQSEPLYNDKNLAIKSNDLMELCALKAGPALGELRRYLLEKVWENPDLNEREALSVLAKNWAQGITDES